MSIISDQLAALQTPLHYMVHSVSLLIYVCKVGPIRPCKVLHAIHTNGGTFHNNICQELIFLLLLVGFQPQKRGTISRLEDSLDLTPKNPTHDDLSEMSLKWIGWS